MPVVGHDPGNRGGREGPGLCDRGTLWIACGTLRVTRGWRRSRRRIDEPEEGYFGGCSPPWAFFASHHRCMVAWEGSAEVELEGAERDAERLGVGAGERFSMQQRPPAWQGGPAAAPSLMSRWAGIQSV